MTQPLTPLHPLVAKAREKAIASHDACGHKRSDGTPYWTHPERVAATEVVAAADMYR